MEVVVTTGAKTCKAPVRSSPPTNQHPAFYRPDALPAAKPRVSEQWRKSVTFHHLQACWSQATWDPPTLSLTTKGSWLPWRMDTKPLISPLMPISCPQLMLINRKQPLNSIHWCNDNKWQHTLQLLAAPSAEVLRQHSWWSSKEVISLCSQHLQNTVHPYTVFQPPPPLLLGGDSYYLLKHCLLLIIFGRHIPEGCWLKMMLSIPNSPYLFLHYLVQYKSCKFDGHKIRYVALWCM